MSGAELQELRRRIDAAARARLRKYERIERELADYAERDCASGYLTPTSGYRNGCRCDWCRVGATDARNARRERAAA